MNITCPHCGFGRNVDENALPPKAVMATCPKCKHRFKFRELPPAPLGNETPEPRHLESNTTAAPQPHTPVTPVPPTQDTPPKDDDLWNELEALNEPETPEDPEISDQPEPILPLWERVGSGYAVAFVQTMLDMISNPRRFFSCMPVGNGYIKPLIFFLIIIETVALSQALWQFLGILPPSTLTENLAQNFQALLALILYPLQVIVFLFLDTAINHSFLRLFRADTKGFEGTFRAEVYSSVPMLLMIIPYIGLPLAMIGVTIYKFLGLKHIHGATTKQVVAVLVLPMLIAVAIAVFLALLAG